MHSKLSTTMNSKKDIKKQKVSPSKSVVRSKFQSEISNISSTRVPIMHKLTYISPEKLRIPGKPQSNKRCGLTFRLYFDPRSDMLNSKILIIHLEGVIVGLNTSFFVNSDKFVMFIRGGISITKML